MSFHNPGLVNVDFMIGKRVIVGKGMSAVFRAELFNLFNHTNFVDVDNRGSARSRQRQTRASFSSG